MGFFSGRGNEPGAQIIKPNAVEAVPLLSAVSECGICIDKQTQTFMVCRINLGLGPGDRIGVEEYGVYDMLPDLDLDRISKLAATMSPEKFTREMQRMIGPEGMYIPNMDELHNCAVNADKTMREKMSDNGDLAYARKMHDWIRTELDFFGYTGGIVLCADGIYTPERDTFRPYSPDMSIYGEAYSLSRKYSRDECVKIFMFKRYTGKDCYMLAGAEVKSLEDAIG